MSDQENQLIVKMANFVLVKIMSSRVNIVNFSSVARFTNVPVEVIKMASKQICKCIMENSNVEDVDMQDDCAFEVLLKRRVA